LTVQWSQGKKRVTPIFFSNTASTKNDGFHRPKKENHREKCLCGCMSRSLWIAVVFALRGFAARPSKGDPYRFLGVKPEKPKAPPFPNIS
jgi:hypothetical protein